MPCQSSSTYSDILKFTLDGAAARFDSETRIIAFRGLLKDGCRSSLTLLATKKRAAEPGIQIYRKSYSSENMEAEVAMSILNSVKEHGACATAQASTLVHHVVVNYAFQDVAYYQCRRCSTYTSLWCYSNTFIFRDPDGFVAWKINRER